MKKLLLVISLVLFTLPCFANEIVIENASAGDIASVGDVISGAAFDGTQGTTLTFYNVGGNATLAYNGTTLTASKYLTANLTGNVTGNASGSSGSCTGLAATATALATARAIGGVNFDGTAAITPTTIVVADTADATCFVGLWTDAIGSLLPKTDAAITYDATTGILTSTGFAGALTGNVTGNASGSSGSCTGNSATVTNGVYTTNNLSVMSATTSAQLYGVLSDETGSAAGSPLAVFNVNPTLTGATLAGILADNDDMVFKCDADNNGSNSFSFTDGASTEVANLDESGNLQIDGDLKLDDDDYIQWGTDETFKYESTRNDFVASDDIIIEDDNPALYLRCTDTEAGPYVNQAFSLHFHYNEPIFHLALWKGFDNGSGMNVSPNTPLIYWTPTNQTGIQANTNIKGNRKHMRFTIVDPLATQTEDNEICLIPKTDADIIVTKIIVTLDAVTNEVLGDIKFADTFIGLANAVVINTFDTTSGVLEDDSITNGYIPSGKCVYLSFDSAPHTDIKQMSVDVEHYYV